MKHHGARGKSGRLTYQADLNIVECLMKLGVSLRDGLLARTFHSIQRPRLRILWRHSEHLANLNKLFDHQYELSDNVVSD